jgi:p-aminobenzoyl-glutamate transporter AbgT
MAAPRRTITRAFRKQMLRSAAFVFGTLIAVLLILVGIVDHKVFLIAAMVLIPVSALSFNFMQRRAYAAFRLSSSGLNTTQIPFGNDKQMDSPERQENVGS